MEIYNIDLKVQRAMATLAPNREEEKKTEKRAGGEKIKSHT